MSVQIVLDVTNEYNSGSESGTPYLVKLDTGGYDYAVVQAVNASNVIFFFHTNDSGDVQGVSDGSAVSSTNPVPLQGLELSTDTPDIKLSGSGLWRFEAYGRYLWLDGTENLSSVSKLLVRLYKIN